MAQRYRVSGSLYEPMHESWPKQQNTVLPAFTPLQEEAGRCALLGGVAPTLLPGSKSLCTGHMEDPCDTSPLHSIN
jgi:hypothetical protein